MTKPPDMPGVQRDFTLLTETDLHLFNEGTHFRLYEKMGAHPVEHAGRKGTYFAVWAPDAERVSVVGDFNAWDPGRHVLHARGSSGIWEGFIPGLGRGTLYKYHVASRFHMYRVDKTDPYGFFQEVRPRTASVVWPLDYAWGDGEWMATRRRHNSHAAPVSIYEVHLGSWRRDPSDPGRLLSYGEIAGPLVEHVKKLGFTHVELMPIMEHPFDGSWGYQTTGYFAPTSRHGNPQDFMAFVDTMHRNGIGVLLDWVPSHFPTDSHGLDYFDGTHLYEHADPRKGFHPDWKSNIFNYGRHEVRSFLLSSALFWLDKYHVDGLRVDAVASMLYLDYSRKEGEWIPNQYGGRENLEAIDLLRRLNAAAYGAHPDILMCAEESTAWPMVSRPAHVGGLGFGFKWDMGWMHDTLTYISKEPVHRRFHHHQLSFRLIYAFNENFVLPLSHDEVVHGKGALLTKMPGDDWQKFANLRLLYGYMFAQPGKKLLFQGAEFGQWREWNYQESVDWHLAEFDRHKGVALWLAELNRAYREDPALHELDCEPAGFEWIDCNDADNSVLSFVRKSRSGRQTAVVCNFTPVPRIDYRVGLPVPGRWREVLNSDATAYGGGGVGNPGLLVADAVTAHGRPHSLRLTLPPLGVILLRREDPA